MEPWLSDDVVVTLSYVVISVCIVCPPAEFVSAGLTVQTIYGGWLGSEQLDFIGYHIRRTVATLVVHAALPLGYFLALIAFTSQNMDGLYEVLFVSSRSTIAWPGFLAVSVSIAVFVAALIQARSWLNGKHPIVRQLSTYNPTNWQHVAAEISTEMLRIDKFETGPPSRRLIVTDSWVLLTTTYNVHIAKKIDVRLRLKSAVDFSMHPDFGQHGVQFLDIDVTRANELLFSIRLSSLEFNDLQMRINSPIENLRNVVIRQSLSDQFVVAFLAQIDNNPRYELPPQSPEIEMCIGCMQKPANVKLQRLCLSSEDDGSDRSQESLPPCQQCFCRPMWCAECLGRWFAARQDQSDPSTWMSHKCGCPTCRQIFCIGDICYIAL